MHNLEILITELVLLFGGFAIGYMIRREQEYIKLNKEKKKNEQTKKQ